MFGFLYLEYAYLLLGKEEGKLQKEFYNALLNHFEWDGQGKALDIGTGNGPIAILLAKKYSSAKVIGIDLWGKHWNYSKEICEKNANIEHVGERVQFKKASAIELPFNDGEFDVIICNFVFNAIKVDDRKILIKEALRETNFSNIKENNKNNKRDKKRINVVKAIAFTGKSGVGKTTCLVLFLNFLIKNKKDYKILVIDASKMAFHTLKRILIISQEVSLNFGNYWVLGNRFLNNKWEIFIQKLKTLNEPKIQLLGFIPEDINVMKYNLLGKNLLNLPDNNVAYKEVKELFKQII